MLLAVDVGNTNVTLGVFQGERLLHRWRLATRRETTADEFAVQLRSLLQLHGLGAERIGAVVACSVVPPLEGALQEACARHLGWEVSWVTGRTDTGIAVLYEHPAEVGADRLVNAAAAYHLFGAPAVVVDFGTATTFDVLSAAGEYLGGAIAPGVTVSLESLFQRTSLLPRVPLVPPRQAIGRTTVQSIQSGVVFGYAGLVDGLVGRLAGELGAPPRVVATGGLAPLIAPFCTTVQAVEPDLTLHGLRLIHERNAARGGR